MRLDSHTVLPDTIARPRYQRERHGPGIVHLGVGAFHKAHQARYTEAVLNQFGGDWRITGVSLRSAEAHRQLADQDYLYTLEVRDGSNCQRQVIGALADLIVAPQHPQRVVAALSAAQTAVVTLTVTEKGYCLSPQSSRLDCEHPDIHHDLAHPDHPRSALGYLAAGLRVRRQLQRPGLTLISCDNISGNGEKLRHALLGFCQLLDPALAQWIDRHCRFPSTMVDRIVPASSDSDILHLEQATGYRDRAAVFTEPFSQWVIENNFAGPVPAWNRVGAEYVDDVAPFETMKLRMLNAAHSAIAYIGVLAGYPTVDTLMAVPALHRFVESLMRDEAAPTLALPAGYDLRDYRQRLLQRFANTALQHRCQQIAMDGSQKNPNRLLPILRWQLEHDGPIACTTAALAAWLRYTQGVDEAGNQYQVDDPMAAQFTALFETRGRKAKDYLPGFRSMNSLFPQDIASSDRAFNAIAEWLERFESQGVAAAITAID